jgi:hypothetical protein
MAPAHRLLLLGQAVGGLVLNFLLNGAAAWVGFPPVATLPLWARGNCVGGDAIGTSFFLPLTTCLVVTALVRRGLRAGAFPPLAREALPAGIRRLPDNMVARGALVGLACALTLAPATCAALGLAGVAALTRGEDTLFKALYTALLGLLVTPLLGLRALADDPGRPPG